MLQRILIRLRVIIGLALLAGLAWYFKLDQTVPLLMALDVRWLLVVALLIIAAVIVGGANLYLFIGQRSDIPFKRFFPLFWMAWAFSLVVPGQIGDVASLPILLRRHSFSWSTSLGCLVLDKLISFTLIACLALGALLPLMNGDLIRVLLTFILVTVVIVAMLWHTYSTWSLWFSRSRFRLVRVLLDTTCEVVVVLRTYPERVALNVCLTGVKIFLLGLSYWAMFAAFGQNDLPLIQVILLMSAGSIVAYIPISFNGLGTVEIAGVLLFATLNIPEVTVLSVYLAMRVLVLSLAWIPNSYLLLHHDAK